MFEDLIRTLENLDGRKVSVEIPADPEGYFDRACPSESCLFEFKIHEDDWKEKARDEEVFCPFCRHGAPSDQWWTERQLAHARQAAFGQVKGDIKQAMKRDADRWNRRQPRNSFIRITMSVDNKPRHIALPPAAAEPMEMKVACPACECRYAVIGAAYFCPACGHNSVERDFQRSIETQLASLDAIIHVRQAIEDRDVAENTIRTIVESGLLNAVTAFQRYAEALYLRKLGMPAPRRNAFQNLGAGSGLWQQAYGHNFVDHLGAANLADLNRYFQQRHLLAHKDGLVDADYIQRSGDASYTEGQRIVIKESGVRKCLALVEQLARALEVDATGGSVGGE
jgi:hypothetical protein